jgi:hypothetical protein
MINEYIKTHEWKTVPCFSGPDCWCRMVVCSNIPDDSDPDDYVVIASAAVGVDIANMIVEDHNSALLLDDRRD